MSRWTAIGYGLLCYSSFLAVFVYTIGFVSGVGVPKSIDGPPGSIHPLVALAIDLGLLAVFAIQHSVMARRGFKRRWSRWVPPPIERSTYVLASSAALALLFWLWQPLELVLWNVTTPLGRIPLQSVQICGWLLVLIATALINHADLFGLRQVLSHVRGRRYFSPGFVTPGPYHLVRHPLYLGWLVAFWATPSMTAGHFVFAAAMTVYVLIAIRFEERDLLLEHGRKYRSYRRRVPMLLPFRSRDANRPGAG